MKDPTCKHFIQLTCSVTALLLGLQSAPHARGLISQPQNEVKQLESGKAVEREIGRDESHQYQLTLTAGQFVRLRRDDRAIDAALTLSAPEGKQKTVCTPFTTAAKLTVRASLGARFNSLVYGPKRCTLSGTADGCRPYSVFLVLAVNYTFQYPAWLWLLDRKIAATESLRRTETCETDKKVRSNYNQQEDHPN